MQYLRIISIVGAFLVGAWLPTRLTGLTLPLNLEIEFDLLVSFVAAINIYIYFIHSESKPRELRFWLNFNLIFDLICLVPFALISLSTKQPIPNWLLLSHLLVVRHVRHVRPFLDHFNNLQPITYRLVPLAVMMPLLVHLIACGWIALGNGSSGVVDDLALMYTQAVYWTFTTLTTVGYGDITPKTITQMLYSSGVQVVGVGVFGFILSNVASLISRSDAAREHHMNNLDKIETYMRIHQIPMDLRHKIRSYFHYLWKNKKGYKDESLLEGLPAKIQSELFYHINHSILEKVPFLNGASSDMIEDLMNELESHIFVPGERIFRVDEPGDALYFIHSGQVEVITREDSTIAVLSEGSFFGEMALISDSPRNATVRAITFCDIYRLSRESFERVTTAYPEFKNHVEKIVRQRKAG